jgi:HD-like signal output (HDOD) protein/GGDEF domain-containing protein
MSDSPHHPALERVLACPNLPTLPVVAMRVLELTAKPDVSLREIAAVIENDPAIATKVLRTVNSSYYALTRRCASIQQALAFLGLQTVKALVLGFSLARCVNGGGDDEFSFDFTDYWRRSIYSAASAREIAMLARGCDPDEAFVASLVQDIGMVALWRAYGDRYLQVVELAKGDHRRLAAIEQRTFEIDHTIVGAEMLARWRFPEEVAEAVRCQHRSHEAFSAAARLARTVELAGTAASVLSTTKPHGELARFRREGQDWFEIRPGPMTLLLQRIADQADELSRAFGLDTGASADVDAILRAAEDLRRGQGLSIPEFEADPEDVPVTTPRGFASIPDARAFGTELEAAFHATSGCATRKCDGRSGIGMMLVGIDRAKSVQDAFGTKGLESALDRALDAIVAIGGGDVRAFRFVGAEIAVLLPRTDTEELCRIAECVRRRFAEGMVRCETASGAGFPATVSIGAAIYEPDPELQRESEISTPDQLVSASMFALTSGRRVRNRVVLFRREHAQAEGPAHT